MEWGSFADLSMPSPEFDQPEFHDNPVQELETSLAAQIPGLRLLDRQLEMEVKRGVSGRVDFAGVDAEGRLVLVLLLDSDSDAAALAALDLFVMAKRHAALLARHLDIELGERPRLILVAETYDVLLMARLEALGHPFELLSIETLRSERGARSYLVPQFGSKGASVEPDSITRQEFVAALTERQRVPAELLIDRLHRMDSEVKVRYLADGVRWTFQGHEFLGLKLSGEDLVGFVLPSGEDQLIDSVERVETLVEAAFGAYVRLIGMESTSRVAMGGMKPAPQAEAGGTPLLTEEEIAAFQI